MAKKKRSPLATGEMELMQVLWASAGLTLAEAHQRMSRNGREIGYTTVQTRLERLVEKGLVTKQGQRPATYVANVKPEEVRATVLDSLLNRISGVVPLVAHLVQDPSLKPEDLQEMRRIIDAAETQLQQRKSKPGGQRQ